LQQLAGLLARLATDRFQHLKKPESAQQHRHHDRCHGQPQQGADAPLELFGRFHGSGSQADRLAILVLFMRVPSHDWNG
jgi:hypothetical protein